MKIIAISLFVCTLIGCKNDGRQEELSEGEVSIGPYSFIFPPDYALINEKGVDSNVGKIKNDSVTLRFDYGHYSNKLVQSVEEYLESKSWELQIENSFMKPDITYDSNNRPDVKVVEVRKATDKDSSYGILPDYVAICEFEGVESVQPIFLPEESKFHTVQIDTLNDHFRKIVIADNPKNGTTGIYLSDYKNVNKSINSPLSLSMSTSGITKSQQNLLIQVFESVTIVKN